VGARGVELECLKLNEGKKRRGKEEDETWRPRKVQGKVKQIKRNKQQERNRTGTCGTRVSSSTQEGKPNKKEKIRVLIECHW